MESHFYFDGQVLSGSDPVTLPLSSALLYGKGIFTTVAIHDSQPLLWDKHWARLEMSAGRLGIDLSEHSEESTTMALHGVIAANGVINGRARLTFLDLRSSTLWPVKTARKTALAVMTGETRPIPQRLRLSCSPFTVNSLSPLAGIKSCNYLESIMAIDEARTRGSEEAIRLNERGKITGGCMVNVFWLKDDELFTPSLKTGCLPGTTREYVLENLDCREVEAGIGELRAADALFLTSAGLGILEVVEFESRILEPTGHHMTELWPPGQNRER
ncbi:branched chain amino acid--2-keto-4-methylthiobutyrate aminotransferase [soil metagenome]